MAVTKRGLKHLPNVAGLDEAGRGPLAGPVFAAAVILPKKFDTKGINDSKKLTPQMREIMALRIRQSADYRIVSLCAEWVDHLNILWASMNAMERALEGLLGEPERVLVDGNRVPKKLVGRAEPVIKGDGKYACIAAASILAKTARDEFMRKQADVYPEYGFDRHFGYPTPDHKKALKRYGPCPLHRRSFIGVDDSQLPLFEVEEVA